MKLLYLPAAPWCVRGELGFASVRKRLAGAEHVAFFHFLTEGSCKVRLLEGTEVLEASAGDLVLFPQEGRHLMGTDLQLAPMEGSATVEALPGADPEVFHMRHGGGGTATRFVCGYLALSRSVFRPLFEALPRVLCIRVGEGPASALVRALFREGVRESAAQGPGARSGDWMASTTNTRRDGDGQDAGRRDGTRLGGSPW